MVDHVTRGLARLPEQFKESPRFRFLIQALLEELQEVEDTLEEIKSQKNLDNAVGVQLDGLGEILGKRREGLTDTPYRLALKVQQILNAGEGRYETVLDLWRILLNSPTATVDEQFPAGVTLFSDVGTPTLATLNTLMQALPVTVTAAFTSSIDTDPVFSFVGGAGIGFGSTEDSSGGKFIGRYSSVSTPALGGWMLGGWDTRTWYGYPNSAYPYDFITHYDQQLSY
jgi:hypothetical protein